MLGLPGRSAPSSRAPDRREDGAVVLFAAAVDRAYALVSIVAILNLGIFSLLLALIVRLDYSMFSEFRTWGAVVLWVIPLLVLIVLTVSSRARMRPH